MIASYTIHTAPDSLGWVRTISPVSDAYVARQWERYQSDHPGQRAILRDPSGRVVAEVGHA